MDEGRWWIVCDYRWEDLTSDKLLGPFGTREEAETVMPFALATHPRENSRYGWSVIDGASLRGAHPSSPAMEAFNRLGLEP